MVYTSEMIQVSLIIEKVDYAKEELKLFITYLLAIFIIIF